MVVGVAEAAGVVAGVAVCSAGDGAVVVGLAVGEAVVVGAAVVVGLAVVVGVVVGVVDSPASAAGVGGVSTSSIM